MAIRIYKQNLNNLVLPATDGSSYIRSAWNSTPATDTGTSTTMWFDSSGRINWRPDTGNVAGKIRTFDASAAVTNTTWTLPVPASGNTVTLAALETAQTFIQQQTFSTNGDISKPSINLTGTPYAGTTGNSYPLLFLNNTGGNPTTTTWSAVGTYFGVMGASGFGGNYIDIHPYNSSTQTLRLDSSGNLTINGNHYAAGRLSVGTTGTSNAAIGSYLTSLSLSAAFSTSGFGIRQDACTYTSTTSSGTIATTGVNTFGTPTLVASNTNIVTAGSGYTNGTYTGIGHTGGTGTGRTFNITVSGGVVSSVSINANGSGYLNSDILTINSFSGTGSGLTIGCGVVLTNAATMYIAAPPTAGTNVTATNLYAIYVNSGTSYFGGAIAIGNTVTSAVAVASTNKVQISIAGSTYYLLATT